MNDTPSKDAPQGPARSAAEGINQDAPPVSPPSGGEPGPWKAGDWFNLPDGTRQRLDVRKKNIANEAHRLALQSVEPLRLAAGELVAALGGWELPTKRLGVESRMKLDNLAASLKDLSGEGRDE